MADYWIKLYTEIIDDPKMALLPDRLWRRVIELFLLAKKANKGGELPDTKSLAWLLRINDIEQLEQDLQEIQKTGIIERLGNGWNVTNFAKRQDAVPDAERKRQSRQQTMHKEYNKFMSRNVTCIDDIPVTICDGEAEKETETEAEKESEAEVEAEYSRSASSAAAKNTFSALDTAIAISKSQEYPEMVFVEEIYTAVTEMATIPPTIRAPASEIILSLRSRYPDKQALIDYLRLYFDRWKGQRGKNGKNYSPLSLGWLEWALAGNGNQGTREDDLRRYSEQWKRRSVS